jgi:hypothetical protein
MKTTGSAAVSKPTFKVPLANYSRGNYLKIAGLFRFVGVAPMQHAGALKTFAGLAAMNGEFTDPKKGRYLEIN